MALDTQDLRQRLTDHGWQVREQITRIIYSGWDPIPAFWILESTLPPVGRPVQIEFALIEPDYDYVGPRTPGLIRWRFDLIVRFPGNQPDSPEARFPDREINQRNHRHLFRALEWFRDPVAFVQTWPEEGSWIPPGLWDPHRWRSPAGLEANWDRVDDPSLLLYHLHPTWSDRRLMLLACALTRRTDTLMNDPRNVLAVAAAERYADGQCNRREMRKASRASTMAWLSSLDPLPLARRALAFLLSQGHVSGNHDACAIIRDLAGEPFRPMPAGRRRPYLNDPTVRQMLAAIHADQDYAAMPILADALEDAGCEESRILDHCRMPGGHVRGCWLLDLFCQKF